MYSLYISFDISEKCAKIGSTVVAVEKSMFVGASFS